jgi:hypothetical protein
MKSNILSAICGLALWLAIICLATSCSDSPITHVPMKGFVRDLEFSATGNNLFVTYGHWRESAGGVRTDSFAAFLVGSWQETFKYTSDRGQIRSIFSCADDSVVIYTESDGLDEWPNTLVFRSLTTGAKIEEMEIDFTPQNLESDLQKGIYRYYCDIDSNILYMSIKTGRITALDGSTGQVIREYFSEGNSELVRFVIQKDKNRLVWNDLFSIENGIMTYDISTGEQLCCLDELSSFDCGFITGDRMACVKGGTEEIPIEKAEIRLLNLVTCELESLYVLEQGEIKALWVMENDEDKVLIGISVDSDRSIWEIDLRNNEGRKVIDEVVPRPWEKLIFSPMTQRFLMIDRGDEADMPGYIFGYSMPDFALINEGPLKALYPFFWSVAEGQLYVMAGLAADSEPVDGIFDYWLTILDPIEAKSLDDLRIQDNFDPEKVRVGPKGNWLGIPWLGKYRFPHVINYEEGEFPEDSGFKVVDLSRYRN